MADDVVKNEDGSIAIKLDKPFDHAGERVTELVIKSDLTVADIEQMDQCKDGKDVGKSIRLISSFCNVSLACVRKMHPADYAKVSDQIGGVMGEV